MRYRSATDEITRGAATPEAAARAEEAVDAAADRNEAPSTNARARETRQTAKAKTLEATDLKPGLWVDVDLRPQDPSKQQADSILVIQPVGGADSSPAQLKETRESPKSDR